MPRRALKVMAAIRFRLRRARWLIALCGIGLSGLLLSPILEPFQFGGADFQVHEADTGGAFFSFLILNPPALTVTLLLDGIWLPLQYAVSVAWWLTVAFVLRRRSARPLISAVV